MNVIQNKDQPPIPIVVVGHIDHGKSTLIGRMLNDTKSLQTGKIEELKESCKRRGISFEWSFVLDSLQLERDQAITVDTTQIFFNTKLRKYVFIDSPGHHEFLKNMVTGAAEATSNIIVIDAIQGLTEQTKLHSYLLQIMGIKDTIVVVNKMDLVKFSKQKFQIIKEETESYLKKLGMHTNQTIPVSAINGDNLYNRSSEMNWYTGNTVTQALDILSPNKEVSGKPFRLPVQDVYRLEKKRIIVGKVESGSLEIGSKITVWPSTRSAKVLTFDHWPKKNKTSNITRGQSVGITLEKELFIERGNILSSYNSKPLSSNLLEIKLFWLYEKPLTQGMHLKLKLSTSEHNVVVDRINYVLDIDSLSKIQNDQVNKNEVAEITIRSRSLINYELFSNIPSLGRGVILNENKIIAGCIITGGKALEIASKNLTEVPQSVSNKEREDFNGYAGNVLWMTGLSGAGKSTLAMLLQRELFNRGIHVYTLDGDNIRTGLNKDLGFSEKEREENIRRIAEVAKLFCESGSIVITAFIAPTKATRSNAREIIGDKFHEVFINADLSICESRDVKGLYTKARMGEIKDFTAISSPWEPPTEPDLEINTGELSPNESLKKLVNYIDNLILNKTSNSSTQIKKI